MHIKHLVAGSVVAIGFAFGFALTTASADPDAIVDCSALSKYSTDHRYTRGDTVWCADGPYAHRAECAADTCFDDPLAAARATWSITGRCSPQPSSLQ